MRPLTDRQYNRPFHQDRVDWAIYGTAGLVLTTVAVLDGGRAWIFVVAFGLILACRIFGWRHS